MKIDPKQQGHLPRVDEPSPFVSPDGRFRGWKVAIPGRRSLATPAVVDGRVFVGGGFGSYDFYAFDARDGRLAWQYQTSDDGPTAAAVAEGHVVFNTESCELEVLTVEGAPVWKKWLGDPLMSMPAVAAGRDLHGLPRLQGRPPALPRLLRPADGPRILEAADRGRDHHGPRARRRGTSTSRRSAARSTACARKTARSSGRSRATPPPRPSSGRGSASSASARRSPRATRRGPTSIRPSTSPRGGCATPRSGITPGRPGRPTTSITPSGPGVRPDTRASQQSRQHGRVRRPQGRCQDGPGHAQPRQGPRPRGLGLPGLQAVRPPGAALRGPRRHRHLGRSALGPGLLEDKTRHASSPRARTCSTAR